MGQVITMPAKRQHGIGAAIGQMVGGGITSGVKAATVARREAEEKRRYEKAESRADVKDKREKEQLDATLMRMKEAAKLGKMKLVADLKQKAYEIAVQSDDPALRMKVASAFGAVVGAIDPQMGKTAEAMSLREIDAGVEARKRAKQEQKTDQAWNVFGKAVATPNSDIVAVGEFLADKFTPEQAVQAARVISARGQKPGQGILAKAMQGQPKQTPQPGPPVTSQTGEALIRERQAAPGGQVTEPTKLSLPAQAFAGTLGETVRKKVTDVERWLAKSPAKPISKAEQERRDRAFEASPRVRSLLAEQLNTSNWLKTQEQLRSEPLEALMNMAQGYPLQEGSPLAEAIQYKRKQLKKAQEDSWDRFP